MTNLWHIRNEHKTVQSFSLMSISHAFFIPEYFSLLDMRKDCSTVTDTTDTDAGTDKHRVRH